MAYYHSSSDGSAGCGLILLAVIVIGFLIGLFNRLTENSQRALITKARKETVESRKESNYEKYLDQHPEGKYQKEATDFIVEYYSEMSIVETNSFYNSFSTLERMESVRDKYSGKPLGKRMAAVIDSKIDAEYRKADKEDSVEGWERYKKVLPERYWRDADNRIKEVQDRLWGTESKAWKTATRLNSLSSYERYLELYPKGAHSRAADKKVIDLTVAGIMAGEHGTLPSMDKVSYGYSSYNTISVKNDTQYTLTLLYSGQESKRLVLNPHGSGTVTLPNGTYHVGASVAALNVRPYAGTETLTGGQYEVSYYISTTRR